MFTPPPSPAPQRVQRQRSPSPSTSGDECLLNLDDSPRPPSSKAATCTALQSSQDSRHVQKIRATRRIRWTIIIVPMILILIAISTRCISHPPVLDILSGRRTSSAWRDVSNWQPHKRHAKPDPLPSQSTSASTLGPLSSLASSGTSPIPSATGGGPQAVPTIPTTPPTLPTPFPQPLDSSISTNFTTQSCLNFFQNMTQSTAFRSCRPFSLLSQTSSAFISAQDNITMLNNIIWGTCNTNTTPDQCDSNMSWFANSLKEECANDIKSDNAVVEQTLEGLEAFTLMRKTACLADQSTGAYCYVEAVHSTEPADLYFYSLPYGTALPASIQPSCSACTKSVMAQYAQAGSNLTGLAHVYDQAAQLANKVCGSGYVQLSSTNAARRSFIFRLDTKLVITTIPLLAALLTL